MKSVNNAILFISFSVFGLSDSFISPLLKILFFLFFITIYCINNKNINLTNSFFSDKFKNFFTYSFIIFLVGLIISSIFSGLNNILETLLYSGLWFLKLLLLIILTRKVEFYKLIKYFGLSISLTSLITLLSNRDFIQNLLLIRYIRTFLNIGGSLRGSIVNYHPNQLSGIVGIILIILLLRYFEKFFIIKNFNLDIKSFFIEISYLFLLIINGAILIITNGRSVLLSIGIVILLMALVFIRLDKKNIQRNLILSTTIITVSLQLIDLNKLFVIDNQYRGLGSGLTGRSEIYLYFVNLFSSLGLGYLDDPERYVNFHFHNSYIAIIVQGGIVFGSFLIFSFIANIYGLIKLFINPKFNKENFVLLLFIPYILIHSFFENLLIGMTSVDSFILILLIHGRFIIKKNESSLVKI